MAKRRTEEEELRNIEQTGEVDVSFKDEIYNALRNLNLSKSNQNLDETRKAKAKAEALLNSLKEEMSRIVAAGGVGMKPPQMGAPAGITSRPPMNGPAMKGPEGINSGPAMSGPQNIGSGPSMGASRVSEQMQDAGPVGAEAARTAGKFAAPPPGGPSAASTGAPSAAPLGGPSASSALTAAAMAARRGTPLGAAATVMSSSEVAPGTLDPEKYPIARGAPGTPPDVRTMRDPRTGPSLAPSAGIDARTMSDPRSGPSARPTALPGRKPMPPTRGTPSVAQRGANGRMDATAEENITKELNNQQARPQRMLTVQVPVPGDAPPDRVEQFVRYIGGVDFRFDDVGEAAGNGPRR